MATEFYRQGLAAYRAGNPKAGVYYFSQVSPLLSNRVQNIHCCFVEPRIGYYTISSLRW